MSFTCYPIIITQVEGEPLPTAESVMKDLIANSEIPIRLITDKENHLIKEFREQFKIEPEYVIVVIKYLNQFRA